MSDNFVRPPVCPSVTDEGSLLLEQFFLWFKKEGGGGRSWQIIKFRSRNSHIRPAGYSLLCLVIHTSSLNTIHKVRIYQFRSFEPHPAYIRFLRVYKFWLRISGWYFPVSVLSALLICLKLGVCVRARRVSGVHIITRAIRAGGGQAPGLILSFRAWSPVQRRFKSKLGRVPGGAMTEYETRQNSFSLDGFRQLNNQITEDITSWWSLINL